MKAEETYQKIHDIFDKYERLGGFIHCESYSDVIDEVQSLFESQLKAERTNLKLPIEFIKHITGIKQKSLINKKWKEWLTSNPK